MTNAYSLLHVKSFDDERRIFRGIATSPDLDLHNEIMDPLGATFAAEIPLLAFHNQSAPVGRVRLSNPTAKGIEFEAEIYTVKEEGTFKTRCDEMWHSVKYGAIPAVSIGAITQQVKQLAGGIRKITKYIIFELSLVTVPANSKATISLVKSLDQEILKAASGTDEEINNNSAGVSAKNNKKTTRGNILMKTLNEQLAEAENELAVINEENDEILTKGLNLSAEEDKTFEDNASRKELLVKQINRLKGRIGDAKDSAVVVKDASAPRARQSVIVKGNNLPKGYAFTKLAMVIAKSKGNLLQAEKTANSKDFDEVPEVRTIVKAAVDIGTTTGEEWAKPLVEYETAANEFLEILRDEVILGKLQGFHNVPFNRRIVGQSKGSTVGWVGETRAKPVSSLGFYDKRIGFAKLAGIVVVSDELIKFSDPAIVPIVQRDLVAGIAEFLDDAFLNPTYAAVEGISPASITFGVDPITASGATLDNLRADVQKVFGKFRAAKQTPYGGYWIMSGEQALAISMIVGPLGQPIPEVNVTMSGGTLFGLPVVVSDAAVTEGRIYLVKPSEIMLAQEGITIDSSDQASIIMDSDPNRSGAPAPVSLWQNNLLGIRAERFINWAPKRDHSVAFIEGAEYGFIA